MENKNNLKNNVYIYSIIRLNDRCRSFYNIVLINLFSVKNLLYQKV